MINRSRTIKHLLLWSLAVALIQACFTYYIWTKEIKEGENELKRHARIIANEMWEGNRDGARTYLMLAAQTGFYHAFDAYGSDGSRFIHVEGPALSGINALLATFGLVPLKPFEATITYHTQKIGTLRAQKYIMFIYPTLNLLVFLLLIMFVSLYMFHLFSSQRALKEKVNQETRRLKESERRFQDLVNMLPEMVWEADAKGRITYANKIALEKFGYTEDDINNRTINLFDILLPEEIDRGAKNYAMSMQGKDVGFNEYKSQTKDGKILPILIRSAPIIRDGKLIGARGILIDITELKQLEQQLFQAQKLEAIGTLAGGIAHDFNNILTAIIGYIQIVQIDITDSAPSLARKLDEALNAALRARDLVQQILTFSRKTEQSRHPLKLSTILKEAIKLLRSSIPTTIGIKQEINTSATILADATRMHQMIMNLCTNAFQAIGTEEGQISIRLYEQEIQEDQREKEPGSYVVLEISDTGCGIQQQDLDRIFDPYFTTKDAGEGTGLGLAVVHGIVEEHQGYIDVDSKTGQGTTFRISLPVHQQESESVQQDEIEIEALRGSESVMVVDDEEQILDILREYLGQQGYCVTTFSSPVDALDAFNQNPRSWDLIITDQTMPGMTGIRLSREMHRIRPDIPVILCSGYSATLSEETFRDAGISLFLHKPVVLNEVIKAVRTILDSAKK